MNADAGIGIIAFFVGAVILLLALAVLAFCVIASIDVLRRPNQQWDKAGQNQIIWVAVVAGSFLLGLWPVGAVLYWFIARPALEATQRPTLAS